VAAEEKSSLVASEQESAMRTWTQTTRQFDGRATRVTQSVSSVIDVVKDRLHTSLPVHASDEPL